MTTIYGIKSCSTMKKAFTKLDALGIDYNFHDYKKLGIDQAHVQKWVDELGIDKVLNKRGTTWRKLSDEDKEKACDSLDYAIELLINNTSMIKRPIVESHVESRVESGRRLLCGYVEAEFDTL